MRTNKYLALFFITSLIAATAFSDEKTVYLQLLQNNKMKELKEHLDKWEKSKPNDPEMFIGFFNYYINMGREETIVLGGKNPPKNEKNLSISDPKTGETVGYLYGEVHYDQVNAEKALQVINRGLDLYPGRLDMHFGKTRLLADLHAYDKQKEYILKIFDIGKANKNKWLWSDSKALPEPEEVFVLSIHDYIAEWLNAGDQIAFENVKPVSEALITFFPKSIIGYNDNALYYANKGDLENAEKQFLAGHKIDPKDEIIISNLAYLYEATKNIPEAEKYYVLLSRSKDSEYADYAKKKLQEMK